MPCAAQPDREVSIAVQVARAFDAVDAGGALDADGAAEACPIADDRCRGVGASEAERSHFAARGITRSIVEAVDRDDSADRFRAPQGRLRPTHDLDSRGEVGVQYL